MNNSNLTMSVINNITSKLLSSSGDFPLDANQSYNVHTSGFVAKAGKLEGAEFEVKTITSSQTFTGWNNGPVVVPSTGNGWQYTIPNGNTIPNDNTWYPSIPYIGDPPASGIPYNPPPPFAPAPFPQIGKIEIIPDLEQLEEGIHDIKGGKIIIKKIKITEEQIETALEEELGHKPTDEEKQKLHEDLELIAASEEREV